MIRCFSRSALVVGAVSGLAFAQDSMQLTDGRFVIGQKMTATDDGVVVHFENGDVLVRDALIKASTVMGVDRGGSWTPEERAKLERGLVLFEGKWIKKERRDDELEKRRLARADKIAEAEKHLKWKDHYVTKTKNFEFHYTIDPEIMAGLTDMMEVYYKAFTKEWGIRKPSKLGRLKVCFYHDEDYFHQVSGAPSGVIGYYRFVQPLELNFFYDRLDQDMTVDVMFHETNHYLTHLIDLDFHYPSWVNESLAEYYGASEWDPERKRMVTGDLQEGRLAVVQDEIKRDRWQGLEELIRLGHGSFNAVHYAWGWSLVHYLLSTPRYERRFKRFYLGLARDRNIERASFSWDMKQVEPDEQIRALKKYLGVDDLKELEKEWHDYVRGLQAVSHRGYHRAGQIALSRGMPIKAQRLFKTSIEMGSENAMTYDGYGRALARKDKYREAIAQFDLAIEKDPLNGMFYVHKADVLDDDDRSGNAAEITRLLSLAEEIEPDNYSVVLAAALGKHRLADGGGR